MKTVKVKSRGVRILDEFNPHIVWNLNNSPRGLTDKDLEPEDLFADSKDDLREHEIQENENKVKARVYRDQFLSLHSKAWDFIMQHPKNKGLPEVIAKSIKPREPFVPLAYRLDVKVEGLAEDKLNCNKFGGIPDLRCHYRYATKEPTFSKLFDMYWPRCGCCHRRMRFLCQLDLTVEVWTIHQLTSQVVDGWPKPISAFGMTKSISKDELPGTPIKEVMFFCNCNKWSCPSADAFIYQDYVFRDKFPFSDEEYMEAARQFMAENEFGDSEMGGHISLEEVTKFELSFDLDHDWLKSRFDYWEMVKDFREEFRPNRAKYTLFGQAHSQQEPKRPFRGGYQRGLYRMSPVINWNDEEHDITRQMYACFRSCGTLTEGVYGKMDNSNT